jgi:hypothetical protein
VLSNRIPPRIRNRNLGGFASAFSRDLFSRFPPEGLGYERYS